ncbi:hypothetical protein HWV62_5298 [Athelia sp. TMB]|nr:hypothetical protein HWV62_16256 [Athelia sp. TMB]KAF7976908.1 hypothetical protein HWV62_5298 [Athelia sp. TMB]
MKDPKKWPNNNPPAGFDNALCAWETFIHRDTPKDVRALDYLRIDSSPNPIDVSRLLSVISSSIMKLPLAAGSEFTFLDRLVLMWPSIWTWIQTLHRYQMRSRLSRAGTLKTGVGWSRTVALYDTIILALRSFTSPDLPRRLAVLVEESSVAQMMAQLWIDEANDPTSRLGFGANQLLCSNKHPHINADVLRNIIDGAQDGPNGPADLLFSRIKNNLMKVHLDASNLGGDLNLLHAQIEGDSVCCKIGADAAASSNGSPQNRVSPPTTMQPYILSHPMVTTTMVAILELVVEAESRIKEPEEYFFLLKKVLQIIMALSQKLQAYKVVRQLLGTSFFTLMSRIAPPVQPQTRTQGMNDFLKVSRILLVELIPRFAVYRSYLSDIHHDLITAHKKCRIIPGGHLNKLYSRVKPYRAVCEDYEENNRDALSCSEPEVCTQCSSGILSVVLYRRS